MNTVAISKFKQKDLIIKKIGMDYKKMQFLDKHSFMVFEDEMNEYSNYKKDINYFKELKAKTDYILLQMDKELSKLIYNEYFSVKKDNWWIYYYSKSTFYRLKNRSMDNFLEWWYA